MAVITVIMPLADQARPDETPVGLERRLLETDGVYEVDINPVSGLVKFVFDDARNDLDNLRRYLEQHGYPTAEPLSVQREA